MNWKQHALLILIMVLLAIVLLPDVFLFLPRLVTEQGFK